MDSWDDLKAEIGRAHEPLTSFPITHSDIRRWAIAAYWPEPPPRVYWDEPAARGTRWGGIIAPQELNPFAWMPERPPESPAAGETRVLNGGVDIEYDGPMRPGDVITSETRVADVRQRTGRAGPLLLVALQEDWTDQRGHRVRSSQTTLVHTAAAPSGPTREETPVATTAGEARGVALACFGEVCDGQELPPFRRVTDLMSWNRFAAVNDGFFYMHMDDEVARASGYPAAFGMGNLQLTYLHNLLRQWVGDNGWVRRIRCRFRGLNFKNDTLTARAVVAKKHGPGEEGLVDLDLWIENQSGRRICSGAAAVVLFS